MLKQFYHASVYIIACAACLSARSESTYHLTKPHDRQSLIRFLSTISLRQASRQILVGQLAAQLNGADNYDKFADLLGDWPAIYHWEARWDYGNIGFNEYCRRAIAAAERGSIVAIGWADKNPPVPGATLKDCDLENAERDLLACSIFWDQWVAQLAIYLEKLQKKQIPVLLRPLHEPENRPWIVNGKSSFRNVWRQLYHELIHRRRLNNVVFVLGLDRTFDSDYLPAAEYVDVVGTSEYENPPYTQSDFLHLQWLSSSDQYQGKIVAICEAGSVKNKELRAQALDYLDAVQKFAPFVSYISWWHESTDNNYQWALYQAGQSEQFMADKRIVTRSHLPWQEPVQARRE